jgi:hypothetical protein
MGARDIIAREVAETYVTPEQRAAYRAGLSSAAMLCDEKATQVRKANPGRGGKGVSQVGSFGADIAKQCGDAITAARAAINVDETPEHEMNRRKMAVVRKLLG